MLVARALDGLVEISNINGAPSGQIRAHGTSRTRASLLLFATKTGPTSLWRHTETPSIHESPTERTAPYKFPAMLPLLSRPG